MKRLILIIAVALLTSCSSTKAPTNTNSKGFAAQGYDVIEYFNNNAIEGNEAYISLHDGVKYKFASQANKTKFDKNPSKYEPQYGGYCAYAVGANGKKVSVNPESYLIDDGKLYLFYDSFLSDTKKKWNEEGTALLKKNADKNWATLKANQ